MVDNRQGVQMDSRDWQNFQAAIKRIPEQMNKRREILKVIRPATKHTRNKLKQLVARHDNTGTLEDSVGNITGRNRTFPNVLVGYRVRGRYRGFHGHLVEYGTKARYRGKGKKKSYTGVMPAFGLVKKAAEQSEAQSVAELEKRIAKYTEQAIAKSFR